MKSAVSSRLSLWPIRPLGVFRLRSLMLLIVSLATGWGCADQAAQQEAEPNFSFEDGEGGSAGADQPPAPLPQPPPAPAPMPPPQTNLLPLWVQLTAGSPLTRRAPGTRR